MWLELLQTIIEGNFGEKLKDVIAKLGISIRELAKVSQVPE